MNNNSWFPRGSGSLSNGELCHDNSARIDHKRGHQWFMDSAEHDLFFNKKQAIESVNETPGRAAMHGSLWCGISSSQSEGQRVGCSYDPMPVQSSIVSDRNISPIIDMEKKSLEKQYGNDASICLSMSQAAEDPFFVNNGLRKVKVNEVTVSDNCLPQLVGNTFFPAGKSNKVMSDIFQTTGNNNTCPAPIYSTHGNTLSLDPASSKTDENFMLTSKYYNGIDNNLLSVGQAFNRGSYYNSLVDHNGKENGNFISMGPTYSKGHANFFPMNSFYNKVNEPFMPKGGINFAICGQQDVTDVVLYTTEKPSISSMVENGNKGVKTSTISFGGLLGNNTEERDLKSSYDDLVNESSARPTGALEWKTSAGQQSENVISKADGTRKNKEVKTRKGSSNNFPSNVKSLLSTGIFDGVPVKYVSWSREKNLRGVVKGTGYLCSCQDCKLSRAVNAYEFELHAGCKTKHPNNHIYFENGKTIYAVVQELKSTPQEMLFEVIQNVTGSTVNQKNFNTWKASYQAATRELQRIYGKDEMIMAS